MVLWSDESKFELFGSNRRVFVRRSVISACVVPTVKHGEGGVMVWVCFAGDTVCDLFYSPGTLNNHGYHIILQQYANPSGLHLVPLSQKDGISLQKAVVAMQIKLALYHE